MAEEHKQEDLEGEPPLEEPILEDVAEAAKDLEKQVQEDVQEVEEETHDLPAEAEFEGVDTQEEIPKGKEKDYGI